MNEFSNYLKLVNNCDPDDLLLSESSLGSRLGQIPLEYVNPSEFKELTQTLNMEQLIPTRSGLVRDYRGLAELMGFKPNEIETRFKRSYNPTKSLIEAYLNRNITRSGVSVNDLLKKLEQLERFDLIDDFLPTLIKLATSSWPEDLHSRRLANHQASRAVGIQETQLCNQGLKRLTIDDGEQAFVVYDAFICYAPEDIQYAQELIELLEEHNIKVATADDLLPGFFEHDALVRLIDDRCRKVVIILTPNFSRSKECEFQTKFASEIGIKAGSPKIIPVVYEPCDDNELPSIIRVLSKLNMTNRASYRWQIHRLIRSLESNSSNSKRNLETQRTTYSMPRTEEEISSTIEESSGPSPVITYANESQITDVTDPVVEPIVELLLSQDSSAISGIQDLNRPPFKETSQSKSSSSPQTVSNSPMNWLKTVKKKMLSNFSSLDASSSTTSEAMLISTNSDDFSGNK